MMLFYNDNSLSESYNPLSETIESLIEAIKTFNKICYTIFQFGNFIMFLLFLLMGIHLYISAKNMEYKEQLNTINIEFVKKRGRIGTTIYFLLSLGFLVKILPVVILWLISPLPTPVLFNLFKLNEYYNTNSSLKEIYSHKTIITGFILFIGIISLSSILMISLGIYLILFNKTILQSELKAFELLFLGLIIGIIFGFAPGLWLLC
jgi:hypothetical protein